MCRGQVCVGSQSEQEQATYVECIWNGNCVLGRKQSRSKQWIQNGISLYFVYFGSQAEQEQAMYVEWIGTIVCVGSQAEQVKKECVGSQAEQEQFVSMIHSIVSMIAAAAAAAGISSSSSSSSH